MESYPYGGYPNAPNEQYPSNPSYYGQVPVTNPYQPYPQQVAYPAAQFGDPRQWSQPPQHPTPGQIPGMPVNAALVEPGSSQWQPMRDEVDVDSSREKIRRTRTACEECRQRKQRCDGRKPCRPCTEQRTECQYRDVQPSRKDAHMDRMIQLAERDQANLALMNNNVRAMYATMGRIDKRLAHESNMAASLQASGQSSANPQYVGIQRSEGTDDWSQTAGNPAADRSKRRRH